MNFKCRCGHTLAANPNPGKTQSVTCSCSLTFNVDCTDGGTFIVSRAVIGERQESNAKPKRNFPKGGHIAPLQNVDGCEYYIKPNSGKGFDFEDLKRLQNLLRNDLKQGYTISIDEGCKGTVSMMNFYDAPIGFRFTILQHELSEAVKAERYEDAAKLRDRIAELEKQIEQ